MYNTEKKQFINYYIIYNYNAGDKLWAPYVSDKLLKLPIDSEGNSANRSVSIASLKIQVYIIQMDDRIHDRIANDELITNYRDFHFLLFISDRDCTYSRVRRSK